MKTKAYSQKYQLELALVPLQHLTSQRQLLQTIFELLPPGSPELPAARSTRDFLNEVRFCHRRDKKKSTRILLDFGFMLSRADRARWVRVRG
jgi:hypothetical protein